MLQDLRSLLARLARRDANFDDLLVGEQAQRTPTGQHLTPVEVGTGHRVHGALGVALLPGAKPDGIGRFLDQQRLIAVQGVEAPESALQLRSELRRRDLHSPARFRAT